LPSSPRSNSIEEIEDLLADDWDRARGKVAGFIESMGLPEKQERAAISLFKSLTYDAQKDLLNSVKQALL
jgi:hypothetical protein